MFYIINNWKMKNILIKTILQNEKQKKQNEKKLKDLKKDFENKTISKSIYLKNFYNLILKQNEKDLIYFKNLIEYLQVN